MKKPHLVVIQRTADGIALAGECSSCGIKYHFQVGGEQADNERKLQELFDQHFKHVHLREDASQAAARVVREATEDK